MALLITGGTGFLGSFLARKLIEMGEKDLVLFDINPNTSRIKRFAGKVSLEAGNAASWTDLIQVFKKYDVSTVFHTAAELSIRAEKSRYDAFRTNVEGTFNILELSRMFDVDRVVFTSSLSVFGPRSMPVSEHSCRDPTTFYGATKACSEILGTFYSHAHGLEFTAVRFPTLMGPYRRGMGASVTFSSFIDDAVISGKAVIRLPPETKNPVLYIRDAVDLLYLIYKSRRVSPLYNVGGVPVSLSDLVEAVRARVPGFIPEFRVDAASQQIAREWTALTEMAIKTNLIEKYREIKELNWRIRFDSADRIVEDHVGFLRSELGR